MRVPAALGRRALYLSQLDKVRRTQGSCIAPVHPHRRHDRPCVWVYNPSSPHTGLCPRETVMDSTNSTARGRWQAVLQQVLPDPTLLPVCNQHLRRGASSEH
jgi:hypothetical protein